jgi:hypothetical protein
LPSHQSCRTDWADLPPTASRSRCDQGPHQVAFDARSGWPLLPLVEQIAAYDKEIGRLYVTHADSEIFQNLPGAGKRLAEWGDDRDRYTGAANVQALAGTSPAPYQSGSHCKAHKRYGCVKPVRNTLHQFARQSTLQDVWAQAYYRRKRAEGKSYHVAVSALANVWVRIIYAMRHKHACYEAATFMAAQQAHSW